MADEQRGKRQTQFVEWIRQRKPEMFSLPRHVHLAAHDLRESANEARREADGGRSRPYTARRAPASMILLFMALEAWVNMQLTLALFFAGEESPSYQGKLEKVLLQEPLQVKARKIPRYYGGGMLPKHDHPHLPLLIGIRHELIHSLPATNRRGEIDRLDEINALGLLPDTGNPEVRYMLYERLETYDLAWWAWETSNRLVEAIIGASGR
jgi:hypothetical protein